MGKTRSARPLVVPSTVRPGCYYSKDLIMMVRAETGWGWFHTLAVLEWLSAGIDTVLAKVADDMMTFDQYTATAGGNAMYAGFCRLFPPEEDLAMDRQPSELQRALTAVLLAGHDDLEEPRIAHLASPDGLTTSLGVRAVVPV